MENNGCVKISYMLADGNRITIEVTPKVASYIEDSERKERTEQRRLRDALPYVEGETESSLPVRNSLFDILEKQDESDHLRLVLNELTEKQIRRIYMRYILGYSYRKIGRMEGVNHKTIIEGIKASKNKIVNFL